LLARLESVVLSSETKSLRIVDALVLDELDESEESGGGGGGGPSSCITVLTADETSDWSVLDREDRSELIVCSIVS
jgi:hypothetical protein